MAGNHDDSAIVDRVDTVDSVNSVGSAVDNGLGDKMRAGSKRWYETEASYDEWLAWWTRSPGDRKPGEPAGREAYDHPDVTVDCAMLAYDPNGPEFESLKILLVRRRTHPFLDMLGLTGTFLHTDEEDELATVRRTLGYVYSDPIPGCVVQQVHTFTSIHRDPRGQTVSILNAVYLGDDAIHHGFNEDVDAEWVPIHLVGDALVSEELAFDHEVMVQVLVKRLQEQFDWEPNVFNTLPWLFTLDDAIRLRCGLYGTSFDDVNRKNFRRKYGKYWTEVGSEDPSDPRSRRIFSLKDSL